MLNEDALCWISLLDNGGAPGLLHAHLRCIGNALSGKVGADDKCSSDVHAMMQQAWVCNCRYCGNFPAGVPASSLHDVCPPLLSRRRCAYRQLGRLGALLGVREKQNGKVGA